MADNSRVQMDTTGAGSLSGRRVLDRLTSIDRNMALMQKDIRTLVRKSASEKAGAFFAREDASESSMEAGRVRRGGSKGFSWQKDIKAGAEKGKGLMDKLFGGIVTGLLGGLLGVMGKVIGGVAVLGYKLVSKLVASIAAAYGIKGMGDAVEKGKPSWMKKTDTAPTGTGAAPQTTTKPTARTPTSAMTAEEMRKYEANRAAGMPAAEAKKQAQGFKGMSQTADSMAAKKATAAAAEGAAGTAAKGGIKGALTQAIPALGKIGGKLSAAVLKTIPFIGPIISLIFDFFEGGEMAESLGVSKASGIMGTILGGAEGGIMNSFMNAGKWAMMGAAIGSVVPVVGTILGGVVGAIIGGIMGYFGGDVIAEKINTVFTGIGRFVEDSWDGLKDIGTYLGSQITYLMSQLMAGAKTAIGDMAVAIANKMPDWMPGKSVMASYGKGMQESGKKDSEEATAKKDADLKAAKDAAAKRDINKATAREGEDAANVVRQANNEEKKNAASGGGGGGIAGLAAEQVAAAKPAGASGGSFPTEGSTSPQKAGAPSGPIAGGDINSVSTKPSQSLLDMIKAKEGFSAKAFWDHKQWSIGYGTQAKDGSEVITKEEAEKRLSADVEKRKAYVLNFGKKNGYSWGEQQVDALTSFVYNLGYGALDQVTGKGKRSNEEIAKAMLQYNKASGQVNAGLAKRRGEEMALFSGGAVGASPQMAASGSKGGSTATLPASQVGAASSTSYGGSFPTGAAVSSASSAVSDGRMELASAPPIVNVSAPPPPAAPSKGAGSTGTGSADVYDRDITKLLVGRAFSFA